MMNSKVINLLLVEDDLVDVEALERAFISNRITNPIYKARDGVEALAMLRAEAGSAGAVPSPYIVLMDINMPRMSGFELLKRMREDEALRDVRVFILSTSSSDLDRMRAAQLGVSGYIVKSNEREEFDKSVAWLGGFLRGEAVLAAGDSA